MEYRTNSDNRAGYSGKSVFAIWWWPRNDHKGLVYWL